MDRDGYDYDEEFPCPKCDGWGHIDCDCGGDLCVCTNYGERLCPVCGGDGSVTETRYERYQSARREWWASYQAAIASNSSRSDQTERPTPQKPDRRAKVKAARKQRQRGK